MLWRSADRTTRPRAWRLLCAAPLLPVLGVLITLLLGPLDPVAVAVLRWAPTVPGYVVAIVAILGLVDRRGCAPGPVAVEVALFLAACLVVVGLLVVGPAGRWSGFGLTERLVLGSAVFATSAIMAAALTLLGVIEAARRSMAVVLLAGPSSSPWVVVWPRPPCSGTQVPAGVARLLIAQPACSSSPLRCCSTPGRPRPPTTRCGAASTWLSAATSRC